MKSKTWKYIGLAPVGYDWIGFIAGIIILFLDSYFIISKLKEQIIREYLAKLNKKEKKIK